MDFFSILKGKCDADIMQKRTKGKTFVENSAKKVFWSSYTFVQIAFSQDFIRILEEIVVATSMIEDLDLTVLLKTLQKRSFDSDINASRRKTSTAQYSTRWEQTAARPQNKMSVSGGTEFRSPEADSQRLNKQGNQTNKRLWRLLSVAPSNHRIAALFCQHESGNLAKQRKKIGKEISKWQRKATNKSVIIQ